MVPDRDWEIRKGHKHTTIYCERTDEIFDILFWAIDGRLDNHELKQKYKSKDKSLGGNEAFIDSAPDSEDSDASED